MCMDALEWCVSDVKPSNNFRDENLMFENNFFNNKWVINKLNKITRTWVFNFYNHVDL